MEWSFWPRVRFAVLSYQKVAVTFTCVDSTVDTLCHNFELNFGLHDERKASLGGRMRNWIIWMPFQIVNFLGILKKFTGIIDDSRVLKSKTCQKMNYNHRYSCIHVDGLGNHNLWCWMNDVRIFFQKNVDPKPHT